MKEQKNDTTGINDGRRENKSYSQFEVDQKLHEEKEDWDLVASVFTSFLIDFCCIGFFLLLHDGIYT